MAEIVPDLDRNRASKPVRYKWDVMSDGKARKFTRGVDFHCRPGTFRQLFYGLCLRRGWKSETEIKGDDVYLQAIIQERT